MTKKSPTLLQTLKLIKQAHSGQTDKNGEPYWKHPFAVMLRLPAESPQEWKQAALLHDTIEDTAVTYADLEELGYPLEVIRMVRMLTRLPEDKNYQEWIAKLAKTGHEGAIRVKLADLGHNTLPERVATLPESAKGIQKRYAKAKATLNKALETLAKKD